MTCEHRNLTYVTTTQVKDQGWKLHALLNTTVASIQCVTCLKQWDVPNHLEFTRTDLNDINERTTTAERRTVYVRDVDIDVLRFYGDTETHDSHGNPITIKRKENTR